MKKTWMAALAAVVLAGLAGAVPSSSSSAAGMQGYLVVLAGTQGADGFTATGTKSAVGAAVAAAGGTISNDLSKQIGVLAIESPSSTFARRSPRPRSSRRSERLPLAGHPGGGPEPVDDPARGSPVGHAADPHGSGARHPGRQPGRRRRRARQRDRRQPRRLQEGRRLERGLCPRAQLGRVRADRPRRRHARSLHRQPVPRHPRRRHDRGARERARHRRRRSERDARTGQGLRHDRLLLRERGRGRRSPTRATSSST